MEIQPCTELAPGVRVPIPALGFRVTADRLETVDRQRGMDISDVDHVELAHTTGLLPGVAPRTAELVQIVGVRADETWWVLATVRAVSHDPASLRGLVRELNAHVERARQHGTRDVGSEADIPPELRALQQARAKTRG